MSCRIDRVVTAEKLVVLFISGRITGEHVDCFGACWNRNRAASLSISKTFFSSTEKP
jgi:hypothetical protein